MKVESLLPHKTFDLATCSSTYSTSTSIDIVPTSTSTHHYACTHLDIIGLHSRRYIPLTIDRSNTSINHMCIVEQKTYHEADGSPRLIERIRRCENAIGSNTCSNTRTTLDTVRIVETKPDSSSSSSRKDEVVTDNNGRTRTYRDLSRRSSQKHKTGHSRRSEKRDFVDTQRPAPSSVFEPRKPSPISRPDTPNSAPPTMSSFTRDGSSKPAIRFRPNGTAVYNAPPSLLDIPRAIVNERLNTHPAERKVSFEDDAPSRHHHGLSNNTGARGSATSSPTMASPGLSRLPSLRHNRTDSARDLSPFRDPVKPEREDKEYAAREFSRETLRRQKAEAEATRRRQEDLEAAENRQLNIEAQQARNRRPLFADPPVQPRRMPENLFSHRDSFVDDEPSTWSRHTSPPAPPRLPRPTPNGGTRYASASPLPTSSRSSFHRSGTYGRATVHQYHYPDSPPVVVTSTVNSTTSSRRPSDSIRDRGREVIERERTREAAKNLQRAVDEGAGIGSGPRSWEPVFDEVEERVSGREYYYVSEGPARLESRRRHGSWREERKRDFWS